MIALFAVLCLAGGASKANTLGQGFVRAASFLAVAGLLLARVKFNVRELRAPFLIIAIAALLVALQIVPIPFSLWTKLPGRELISSVTAAVGLSEISRPIAIVPDGALNALLSLSVPFAVLVGMSASPATRESRFLPIMIAIVCVSALCGLIQLSGGIIDNPFINSTRGQAAGLFANRNHQALFLAVGVPLTLAWGYAPSQRPGWRGWTALGIVLLLSLMVIGTGSRAGLGLLAVGLVGGGLLVWPTIAGMARRAPRWVLPTGVLLVLTVLIVLLLVSVDFGRAEAIDRLLDEEVGADMRSRAFPTLISMIMQYFPVGSGLGSFDSVFRMVEPFNVLKPTYFNHAHNDYIELLIEGGLPFVALLAGALVWFFTASWRAWRSSATGEAHIARTGSVIILLVLLASIADYPARTPLIMAVLAVSATWLCSLRANAEKHNI
ncbi:MULTISPECIES: O-antigen ligase family protein [unclassified Sphingomonas]|uniref:O-antigen ligase family protein n=1 Tax=unclassified Sphingomonas TaxID=196159 RepID=UPI00140426DC|nr:MULTISPECIES: O-antigen ligase family protein [unclassified Sphingomonas]